VNTKLSLKIKVMLAALVMVLIVAGLMVTHGVNKVLLDFAYKVLNLSTEYYKFPICNATKDMIVNKTVPK